MAQKNRKHNDFQGADAADVATCSDDNRVAATTKPATVDKTHHVLLHLEIGQVGLRLQDNSVSFDDRNLLAKKHHVGVPAITLPLVHGAEEQTLEHSTHCKRIKLRVTHTAQMPPKQQQECQPQACLQHVTARCQAVSRTGEDGRRKEHDNAYVGTESNRSQRLHRNEVRV